MTIVHKRAKKAWRHLLKVAKNKRKITYGELCKLMDPDNPPNPHLDTGEFLV